jgi:hypothetical protein
MNVEECYGSVIGLDRLKLGHSHCVVIVMHFLVHGKRRLFTQCMCLSHAEELLCRPTSQPVGHVN